MCAFISVCACLETCLVCLDVSCVCVREKKISNRGWRIGKNIRVEYISLQGMNCM